MKINTLFIICILLKVSLSIQQMPSQCGQIKVFMNDNNIRYNEDPSVCCGFRSIPGQDGVNLICNGNSLTGLQIMLMNPKRINFTNFPKLPALNNLSIYRVIFDSAPKEFLMQPTLSKIFFYYSQFPNNEVPREYIQLPLKEFSIKNSKIAKFPYFFKESKSLTTLTIAGCELTELTEEIKDLTIQTLFINDNKLETLPTLPPSLFNLEISHNQIKNLNFEIFDNVIIKGLVMNNNPIQYPDLLFDNITKDVNRFRTLNVLDLGKTGVTRIPNTINNLSMLATLDLANNTITVLPEEIYDIQTLAKIDLLNNSLEHKFGFNHKINECILGGNSLCVTNGDVCVEKDIEFRQCTEEDLKQNDELLNELLNTPIAGADVANESTPGQPQDGNNKKASDKDQSFFEKYKIILIALIVAIILVVSFVIFFLLNKNNKDQEFIKDDNNATYAYNNGESRFINLSAKKEMDKKEKDINNNTVTFVNAGSISEKSKLINENNQMSNLSSPTDDLQMNSFNTSNNNLQMNNFNTSTDNIQMNNFNTSTDNIQMNNFNTSTDNIQMNNFNTSTDNIQMNNFNTSTDNIQMNNFNNPLLMNNINTINTSQGGNLLMNNITTPQTNNLLMNNIGTSQANNLLMNNINTTHPNNLLMNNINTTQPNNLLMNNINTSQPNTLLMNNINTSQPNTLLMNNINTSQPNNLLGNNMYNNFNATGSNINNNLLNLNMGNIKQPLNSYDVMNKSMLMNNMNNMGVLQPNLANSSMGISKGMMQNNNVVLDNDQLRLKAKIKKEMIATEALFGNKNNGNGRNDYDELPPYSDFGNNININNNKNNNITNNNNNNNNNINNNINNNNINNNNNNINNNNNSA